MRIKIIGDNNCARATRHLLRMAGFAVTEFLPVEAITQAPHHGFAITIELSPAAHPVFAVAPKSGASGNIPACSPGSPTHGQSARADEETFADAKADAGVSSPAFASKSEATAGGPAFASKTGAVVGGPDFASKTGAVAGGPDFGSKSGATPGEIVSTDREDARSVGFSLRGVGLETGEGKAKSAQTEVYATGGHIRFDCVDGALEAAVLRHVAKLAAGPVIVDRPGGVVHSERELRIILPRTGDEKSDEAAAVAVEFGVLRGLLDLVTPPSASADESALRSALKGESALGSELAGKAIFAAGSAGAAGVSAAAKKRKWWHFGLAMFAGSLLIGGGSLSMFAARANASPARLAVTPRRVDAMPRRVIEGRGSDGAYLHLEAALAPVPAQGQFADGQLNIALIGGTAVSGSLYDSGNTALKVNCVVGCSAVSSFSDNGAFTAGSTAVNNISAVFNDSITALTSGNAGALRSTTDRMLYVNVGKLGGTALSGANVVDSGNTAFRVNCVVGCSASAGFADNSSFTAGTTAESNIGGVYNDGLSTLSSGNAAAARITSARALHVNLRNSSGTEIGTSSNPVRVDPVGTTTQPVSVASLPALAAGTNTIGSVKVTDGTNTVVVDPCKGQTKQFASINQTANAQLATGTASKKIYICSIHVVVAAATNVALVEGTGSVCATSTAGVSGFGGATAATGWNFMANGGIAMGNGDASVGAEGTAADNLCLFNSGSGQVSGGISYVVQ